MMSRVSSAQGGSCFAERTNAPTVRAATKGQRRKRFRLVFSSSTSACDEESTIKPILPLSISLRGSCMRWDIDYRGRRSPV